MCEIWRLSVDALLRLGLQPLNRKKPRALAALPRRLCATMRSSSPCWRLDGFLVAADLLGARRIAACAAIDRGKLASSRVQSWL